ncbi:hypothetical protein MY3957_003940 [Beauveria namnaoensis]
MNNDDLRSSIHRFRVRPTSTAAAAAAAESAPPRRRRSSAASPLVGPLPLAARDVVVIPACDRCRSFKKKCSRTFPVCSLCARAGRDCSFSAAAAAVSSSSSSSSSSKAQVHHLRARVAWLSRLIDENNLLARGCPSIEGVSTGSDLTGMLASPSPPATNASSLPAVTQLDLTAASHAHGTGEATLASVISREHPPVESDARLAAAQYRLSGNLAGGAPQNPLARTLVDAYFRHIHRAYPFMNRALVLRDLAALGPAAWPPRRRRADSTLLFLVMALGCTTLQRSGQMPRHAPATFAFHVPVADILQECVLGNDIDSIQILVLLALHCMYDPAPGLTWSVAGIAARQAMALGLSRRADASLSSTDRELRHRLFWSTWVLDRVMAYSTGLPPALSDESIDVPLPGLAVEEFASAERPRFASALQIHRHVIRLRQLEDRILAQVLSGGKELTAQHDRRAAIKEMRTEIENWYSDGCLLSPVEPDNVPFHTSVAWLSARYYHVLLMLHYPCRSNGFGAIMSSLDLLHFAQKHLQSTLVLLQQRQLPLNIVTLARTLPVGLALVYCLMSGVVEPASTTDAVDTLIDVFEAFPDTWTHARRAARVFRQVRMAVADTASQQQQPLPSFSDDARPQPGGEYKSSYQERLRPLAAVVTSIMEDVLGKTTGYAIPEFLCGQAASNGRFNTSNSPTNPVQASIASVPDEKASEHGWGSLQFAFL